MVLIGECLMRRRRSSPAPQIEALQRARRELSILVVLTERLGICLSLLASVGADLSNVVPWRAARYALVLLATSLLAGIAVARFYATTESQWLPLEVQDYPYQVPSTGQPAIGRLKAYGVTVLARLVLMQYYRPRSAALEEWSKRSRPSAD